MACLQYTNLDEINIKWVVIPGRVGNLNYGIVRPDSVAREFYLLVKQTIVVLGMHGDKISNAI